MTGQILPTTAKIAHNAIGLRTDLLLAKMARKCALAQLGLATVLKRKQGAPASTSAC